MEVCAHKGTSTPKQSDQTSQTSGGPSRNFLLICSRFPFQRGDRKEALKQIEETDVATLAHPNPQLSETDATISEYEKIVKGF
jgi:hypothetical protein